MEVNKPLPIQETVYIIVPVRIKAATKKAFAVALKEAQLHLQLDTYGYADENYEEGWVVRTMKSFWKYFIPDRRSDKLNWSFTSYK